MKGGRWEEDGKKMGRRWEEDGREMGGRWEEEGYNFAFSLRFFIFWFEIFKGALNHDYPTYKYKKTTGFEHY